MSSIIRAAAEPVSGTGQPRSNGPLPRVEQRAVQARHLLLLRRLLRAKDRMDSCSHEHWPVRRLAEVSGVSAAHFARSFQQAFGIPPHRYLLSRRIERAKAVLRDTDLDVTRSCARHRLEQPRDVWSCLPHRDR